MIDETPEEKVARLKEERKSRMDPPRDETKSAGSKAPIIRIHGRTVYDSLKEELEKPGAEKKVEGIKESIEPFSLPPYSIPPPKVVIKPRSYEELELTGQHIKFQKEERQKRRDQGPLAEIKTLEGTSLETDYGSSGES